MKTQATRCTQKQLAYMAHWQKLGHVFKRGDVIPENTLIPPGKSWHWAEFAVSGVLILACAALMWWRK